MKTRPLALVLLLAAAPAWAQPDSSAIDTLRRVVQLPVVEVSTTRAADGAPLARSVLDRAEIRQRNWGQDTPMALATLPGAYAYSDAGNGIGYSYLSIRGFPQRRISVLIDGVPLNDPESHEVWWIDHPDLLASTAEVQLQRGVGSALYGAASVGGSVSLETSPFFAAPGANARFGYGSFGTRRVVLEAGSGPLAGGWDLYGRYSRIQTDGYRDQSDSRLWSYSFAARKSAGRHTLRASLFGGPEETHLAYLGVPREVLENDRRRNPITYPGERDHFFEPHYELVHSWAVAPRLSLTQTLFYFDGEGFYDEQRFARGLSDYRLSPWTTSDSTLFPRGYYAQDPSGALTQDGSGRFTVERFDLVRRRWVKNRHYGWVPRVRLEHEGGALTIGGEIRAHDGRHVGTVLSGNGLPPGTEPDHRYYDYHPRTLAAGLFAREEWRLRPNLLATVDLGWRHQDYAMRGDRFDGIRFDQPYDFALPRLGLSWTPRAWMTMYASAAHSRREPAFRDLYDAEGAGSVPLLVNGEPLIRPERVNDYELGVAFENRGRSLHGSRIGASVFRMDFRDELVYAGQFNTDLGYPIIGNAARSIHQGVEVSALARFGEDNFSSPDERPYVTQHPEFVIDANATIGDNHFVDYTEHYGPTAADDVSYDGNTIGFFPELMGNLAVRGGWRGASLGLEAQSVGRIHLDNTESRDASIGPRTVLHLNGGYRIPLPGGNSARASLRVFNLLNRRYATSGYMDYDAGGNLVPQFIPAATRHWLGELQFEF